MVRSHKRTERQWEAIRDKTMQEIIAEKLEIMDWTEIANEMQRWADENGEVRRVYTYLSCCKYLNQLDGCSGVYSFEKKTDRLY